jgi:DNA-3-methyladenine glycosylase II
MFRDPVLQSLVKKYPVPKFEDRSKFLYQELIEAIVSQQLSTKAAATIFGRFKELFGKKFPTPQQVLKMDKDKLRACGISYPKISYIQAIAQAFKDKQLNHKKLLHMKDEEIVVELTKIKGVGQWTAEMMLIFVLNRPDIFSIGDLGIRNAITKLYGIKDKKEMLALSEKWKPHRSTACWYLWRSLENKKES